MITSVSLGPTPPGGAGLRDTETMVMITIWVWGSGSEGHRDNGNITIILRPTPPAHNGH